jgi:imidazole glycerol-phosphate synthase subunit HisH
MICVVDYGMGNIRSVQKAVQKLGFDCLVTREVDLLEKSEKIILPGVGHFGKGMENIDKFNLVPVLDKLAKFEKKPVLGICLGMQLMTDFSEEGNCDGLGWIKAKTLRFNIETLKIPHIGWNTIDIRKNTYLTNGIEINNEFYFVHSYYVKCQNDTDVAFRTDYGILFDSGFVKENIAGVQFHPEKSHQNGLKVLRNFLSSSIV